MNFFEKFKEDLFSDDLTIRNNVIFKLIAAVVVSLVVICAIVVSAYDWISSDFKRVQNVSIIGGLVITVALSWGSKAGNLRRILKSMLRDFEFYKFTTVDVDSLVFRFCNWIFWSALIASCLVRFLCLYKILVCNSLCIPAGVVQSLNRGGYRIAEGC